MDEGLGVRQLASDAPATVWTKDTPPVPLPVNPRGGELRERCESYGGE